MCITNESASLNFVSNRNILSVKSHTGYVPVRKVLYIMIPTRAEYRGMQYQVSLYGMNTYDMSSDK
ncbi:hypothetical protein C5167_026685 [Papaver somniferum]|nr:hypothetical protein C5167_026685 [Papaver somniferum]